MIDLLLRRDRLLSAIARIRQLEWLRARVDQFAESCDESVAAARRVAAAELGSGPELWRTLPEGRVALWSASDAVLRSAVILRFTEHSAVIYVADPIAAGSTVTIEYATIDSGRRLRFSGDVSSSGHIVSLEFDGPAITIRT